MWSSARSWSTTPTTCPGDSRPSCITSAVHDDGTLDEEDFDRLLAEHAGRVKLVAISGASNVTGFLNPIHRLAEKAHAAGSRILVDAAQLAPTGPSTCAPTTIPATSISLPCRPTRCTRPTAPVP
jgi:selenocysteine lyase/cysteine desulfurase